MSSYWVSASVDFGIEIDIPPIEGIEDEGLEAFDMGREILSNVYEDLAVFMRRTYPGIKISGIEGFEVS
jgi:hypothetical protein